MEDKQKKGLWSQEEDRVLVEHIQLHGIGKWNRIPKLTGLKRCGKSCRLRWLNYLCPDIKRGCFSEEEDDLIIRLHKLIGNRWSLIAGRVPGRTDNQVKNYWNSHLSKKLGINSSTTKKSPRIVFDQNSIPNNNNNNNNNANNMVISTDMDGDKFTDPVQEEELDLTVDYSYGGNIFLESPSMNGDDNINYCDYFFNFEDYDNILENVDGHCLDLFDLGHG